MSANDWYGGESRNRVHSEFRFLPNVEALAAAKTLVKDSPTLQYLDPGGANRNVVLPAEANSKGLMFVLVNTADAEEALNVLDDASGQVALVGRGETALVFCNGVAWRALSGGAPFASIGAQPRIAKVPFGATELSGAEVNTSFSFPAGGAILRGAWLEVDDAEAGGTVDVGTQGTSNDPDGILDAISLASTGIIMPGPVTTTGLNETYISSMTFGALSHILYVGADEAGEKGSVVWRPQFITGGDPVSMTASGDLNSCSGSLYLDYIELAA